MTCERELASGFRRMGFMSAVGSMPAATACTACARPISAPSAQTAALFDMFCALNGATRTPLRAKIRQSAAVSRLLPAEELLPSTMSTLAGMGRLPQMMRVVEARQDCPLAEKVQLGQGGRLNAKPPAPRWRQTEGQ